MPVRLAAESTEYIRVPVSATRNGRPVDVSSDVVKLAIFPVTQDEPLTTDWIIGDWEIDDVQTPPVYYARLLVGPQSHNLTLTDGEWQVWVTVDDTPEIIVRMAGRILVY